MSDIYAVHQIADRTWRISEGGMVNCYLAKGNAAALLIDTCWGVGDLWGTVQSITAKPVIPVVTHMHPDHMGGAKQFGNYYVHEADITFPLKTLDNAGIQQ